MAIYELPLFPDQPAFQYQITLETQIYTLRFTYNSRTALWSMDIGDQNANWIRTGIPLITAWPLTRVYSDPALPPGDFFLVDSAGSNENPSLSTFGTRIFLYYHEVRT